MASEFRNLAEAQRELTQALQTLTTRLARDTQNGTAQTFTAEEAPEAGVDPRLLVNVLQPGAGSPAGERRLDEVERALSRNAGVTKDLSAALGVNTRAVEQTAQAFLTGVRGVLAGLSGLGGGGGLFGFLQGGFGLVGLGLRIASLFGGNDGRENVLRPFELPRPLSVEATNTSGILSGFPRADRNQNGEVRSFPTSGTAREPQVIVNVNALDTQSFLDRSADVAQAVRDAMLHMHPVNDIVGEV